MHPLIWLSVGVILAVLARVYVVVRTPRGFVPRKRAQTETCHLAVFLGSGKLHTVRSRHPRHPTLTPYIGFHSRRAQQRGPGSRICSGLLAIYTEDVHSERGRPAQRTQGRCIGAAQSYGLLLIFRSPSVISPCKCRPFTCILVFREFGLTRAHLLASDSARVFKLDTRSSPFPAPGACTRTSLRSRSPCYVRSWAPCVMSPSPLGFPETPPASTSSS